MNGLQNEKQELEIKKQELEQEIEIEDQKMKRQNRKIEIQNLEEDLKFKKLQSKALIIAIVLFATVIAGLAF